MEFLYGRARYQEADKLFEGELILGEHRIYLRKNRQPIPSTFIPTEKIRRVSHPNRDTIIIDVYTDVLTQYQARIQGDEELIPGFLKDLVERRSLKKRFLKREWVE
jgi:hypothetical protein